MKFLDINNIIKTNILFSKLQAVDSRRTLEIEAYSCKQTKEQKKHKKVKKPLRFFISALEITFEDHDFSNETINSFKVILPNELKNEMSFVFFTLYKNHGDVEEMVNYLDFLLDSCIDIERSVYYLLDKSIRYDTHSYKVFLIHDKKKKRLMIIKSIEEI